MAIGRRGFLKALGKGAAVGAAMATPAGYASSLDPGTGKDKSMYNFTCTCGESVIGEVPPKDKRTMVECAAGHKWLLTWKGDHFDAKQKPMGQFYNGGNQERLRAEAERMAAERKSIGMSDEDYNDRERKLIKADILSGKSPWKT